MLIKNVIPKHLEPITAKLELAGATVEEYDDAVRVYRTGDLAATKIKTMPHPGFPTDMQPLMTVLLSVAQGTSIITEGIWENRFRYVDELVRMGANIQVDGQVAVIEGVQELQPAPLRASDLRAGAALVMAALAARGTRGSARTFGGRKKPPPCCPRRCKPSFAGPRSLWGSAAPLSFFPGGAPVF